MRKNVEVEEVVKKLIVENLVYVPTVITCDSKFEEDLGADSLDIVELSMNAEKEFNIEISDEEVSKIVTVGDVVSCVERHLDGKPIEMQKWRDRQ